MNKIVTILKNILEHPFVDTIAKFIKKFKSSKSYWTVSRTVILFTIREAMALVYGTILKEYVQKQLEGSDYTWLWSAIEFIFGFGGSFELFFLGLFFFIVLSLAKFSEGEHNTITLKENFLSLLLSLAIFSTSIYAIRHDNNNHSKTHKQQEITHDKLDELKALIKLQGGDEKYFLEKYFGKDYAIILNHPQTYHNFTTLLKQTNKTADELLKEREELLNKIKSQDFSSKLQAKIDKAFKELRYEDTRKLLDTFLKANRTKEKEIIKAHYIKALSYMEQMRYLEAKEEFEKIAPNIEDAKILSDYARIYDLVGKFDKSIEYSIKALKITIFNSLFSEHMPLTAVSYNNMGLAYFNKGDYNTSIRYFNKSLKIIRATLGDTHLFIANIYENIGVALNKNGKNNEAMIYQQQSLERRLNLLDENHTNIARSYVCIGEIWSSKGNYTKALEYLEKALKIIFKNLGEEDQFTGIIYNNIGMVWNKKGDYSKALKYCNKSLEILNKVLSEKDFIIGASYSNIALILAMNGKYDKAIEYYKKALSIFTLTFPNGHPYIDTIESSLKSINESK